MRKLIIPVLILGALISCNQTEWAPEGPSEVRVRNLQNDKTFTNVIIKTAGGRDTTGNIKKLGSILPGVTSEYARVTFAYPKAEIIATIDGETYTTGSFQSTYMTYVGQNRVTYEVFILNPTTKTLKIENMSFDEALVVK